MRKDIIKVILGLFLALTLSACGGGKGSDQKDEQTATTTPTLTTVLTVSGVAAAGAALSGKVYIKDCSVPANELTKDINTDGTFSFDVTDMTKPFLLKAVGSANGKDYTLYSFSDGNGTANVNPMSHLLVTLASGGIDLDELYDTINPTTLQLIATNLPAALQKIQDTLQPLLETFDIASVNPITGTYTVNHEGLDGMLDAVSIEINSGTVTISNIETAQEIFTALEDLFQDGEVNGDNIPVPAPTGLVVFAYNGQAGISWKAVTVATSYNIYWSTSPGVTKANGTQISGIEKSPYKHTKLTNGTMYYYIVTAVKGTKESAPSAVISIKPSVVVRTSIYNTAGEVMTYTEFKYNEAGIPNDISVYNGFTDILIQETLMTFEDGKVTDTLVLGPTKLQISHITYAYDPNGNVTDMYTYGATDTVAGSMHVSNTYNGDGNVILTTTYASNVEVGYTMSQYDGSKNLTKETNYSAGVITSSTAYEYYTNDTDAKVKREAHFSGPYEVLSDSTTYEYNDKGKVTKESSFSGPTDLLVEYTTKEYTDSGVLKKTTTYEGVSGMMTEYTEWEFNALGLVTKMSKYNFSNLLTGYMEYEYNSWGMPVSISTYGPTGLLKQRIENEYM